MEEGEDVEQIDKDELHNSKGDLKNMQNRLNITNTSGLAMSSKSKTLKFAPHLISPGFGVRRITGVGS